MLENVTYREYLSLLSSNKISPCSSELGEISCWTTSAILYAHWTVPQLDIADRISEYLCLGMHHSTPEAKDAMRRIIKNKN